MRRGIDWVRREPTNDTRASSLGRGACLLILKFKTVGKSPFVVAQTPGDVVRDQQCCFVVGSLYASIDGEVCVVSTSSSYRSC